MCGIVGAFGMLNVNEERVFLTMLKLDTIRGKDSTGIIRVQRNGKVDYDKWLGTPYVGYNSGKKDTIVNNHGYINSTNYVLIGHNRAATIGNVTADNAHPFDFENVVGVHNGTLKEHLCDFETNQHETDTEALYSSINEKGVEETIPLTCGAYTLAMIDKKESKLKLIRNSERPLYYAYTKNSKAVFFASEAWMIDVACKRNKVDIRKIVPVEVDTLYHWEFGDFEKGKDGEVKFFYDQDKIKGKKYTPPANNGFWYGYGNSYTPQSRNKVVESIHKVINIYPAEFDKKTLRFQLQRSYITAEVFSKEGFSEATVHIFGEIGSEKRRKFLESSGWWTIRATSVTKDIQTGEHLNYTANISSLKGEFDWNDYKWGIENKKTKEDEPQAEVTTIVKRKDGSHFTVRELHEVIMEGCQICGQNDFSGLDMKEAHFLDGDKFICKDCSDSNQNQIPFSM